MSWLSGQQHRGQISMSPCLSWPTVIAPGLVALWIVISSRYGGCLNGWMHLNNQVASETYTSQVAITALCTAKFRDHRMSCISCHVRAAGESGCHFGYLQLDTCEFTAWILLRCWISSYASQLWTTTTTTIIMLKWSGLAHTQVTVELKMTRDINMALSS
jgi:hypothetical protein